MAFLTIAGVDYPVSVGAASEANPRYVGATKATFSGLMRTSRRARKRVYGFTLAPMSVANYETLITAVATAIVPVTGEALNNATINAIVEVTGGAWISDLTQALHHTRTATLTVTEV